MRQHGTRHNTTRDTTRHALQHDTQQNTTGDACGQGRNLGRGAGVEPFKGPIIVTYQTLMVKLRKMILNVAFVRTSCMIFREHHCCKNAMFNVVTPIHSLRSRGSSTPTSHDTRKTQYKTQHDNTTRNETRHNTTRSDNTQYGTTQTRNETRHNTTRSDNTQHGTTQHDKRAANVASFGTTTRVEFTRRGGGGNFTLRALCSHK